jgi:hypothetical protein
LKGDVEDFSYFSLISFIGLDKTKNGKLISIMSALKASKIYDFLH